MRRSKDPIVVFGAGLGAVRAVACLRHRCRVVAFLDNDPAKHGRLFLGRPVAGPAALAALTTPRIVIASMYADQIYRQLTLDLAIDPTRIEIVPRPILEGAYDVSRGTYAILGALAALLVAIVAAAAYAVAATRIF